MSWENKINTIWQGDCLELMKEMPDECIDLVVTSPPYDNLRDYHGFTFDFENVANELYRVVKKGGVIVWVVGDQTINGSETGTSFKQALFFKEIGFNLHDTMIYEKNGSPYPEFTRYYQCFEYMFVFSKGKPNVVNLLKDRKNKWEGSFGKRSQRLPDGTLQQKEAIKCEEYGVRFNFWRINSGFGYSASNSIAHEHPAIFPEKLVQDHLKTWSIENDLVFDPFMGSWTTAVACQQLKRRFIGSELSEEYCEIGRQRLRQQVLSL